MATLKQALRKHFAKLKDPRVVGRTKHRLIDLIVITICAVICRQYDWQDIETFAEQRLDWFRRFLTLPGGAPSHDTFERLFDRLDPQVFQACLLGWLHDASETITVPHVAIDGKTLCGSANAKSPWGPLHLVSAWATASGLTLGQTAVDGKSNEITAIPKLLELLDVHGALVTIDAMGCQKAIAATIRAKDADYVLAVKENQPHLLEDIRGSFEKLLDQGCQAGKYTRHDSVDRSHGRLVERTCLVLRDLTNIRTRDEWKDLKCLVMVHQRREVRGQESHEVRYYIASRRMSARAYAQTIRDHWGIENGLHWHLDVTFNEDANREQGRNAAQNLALVRKAAVSVLKQHPGEETMKKKSNMANLNPSILEEIMTRTAKLVKF